MHLTNHRFAFLGALALAAFVAGPFAACNDDEGGGGFSRGDDLVITIDPTQVVFASVNVGEKSDRSVRIRHAGTNGVLRIRNLRLESDGSDLSTSAPASIDLEPGGETDIVVTYEPTDAISDSGTIIFDTNVPGTDGGAFVGRIPVLTLAQGGVIRPAPGLVDFGAVDGGILAERNVALINVGQEDVTLTSIAMSIASSPDLSVVDMPTLPAVLAPNGSVVVKLGYRPTGGGSDNGTLKVTFDLKGEVREVEPPIQVLGREVGPRVQAFPNPIDFGSRATGATYDQPLTLSNQGERDLVIASMEFVAGSSETVVLNGFGGPGTVVKAGDIMPLSVAFTPTTTMVQSTGPIARLRVNSNDPADSGNYDILIFGRAEVPILQVNPPDLLDFGFVPQNIARSRPLVLFNAGNAPLDVAAIRIANDSAGEYRIIPDPRFGPVADPAAPGVIGPFESREFQVEFTNRGAASGIAWGSLVIESNDGVTPEWTVSLKSQRAGSPVCDIQLVPQQVDFGIVARGFRRTMTFNLVNVGSGDCSFDSALVNDCASFFGFFQGSCDDPANTILAGGNSRNYRVTRTPLAIQGGLKAGQSYPLEVTFSPPDSAPLIGDEMTTYPGLVAVRVIDPNSGSNNRVVFPKPMVGGLSPYPPNLAARSGIAQLAVLPGNVDFGLTTVGCHSRTIEVTAYNVGSAPLELSDIKLEGCSVEFRVKSSPGLPQTLGVNGSAMVELVYVPQNLGTDTCGIGFYTNNELTATIVVPIEGSGTFDTEHTDTYVQTTGQDVDVLFVVDNSGSMSSNQSNLAANFQSFITAASQWNNNYQIGVTTTDMEDNNGRLVAAAGNARYVTSQNYQQLAQNFRVGTNGSADEKGLAAAQAALSLPLIANTSTTCTADSQCTVPDRCVDGFCGGRNRGFLREDAALEIVLVSDEEDSSPGDLNFYINFFRSIKGVYNSDMMHVHAIVGDVPGGCSTQSGSAVAGRRYVDVATATGGSVISICDSNFSAGLASIGAIAFGLRRQFYLSRFPEPATINVRVAGQVCSPAAGANWNYDEGSNSVVFNQNGGCMPQAGQQVVINYKTLCFLE